MTFIHIQSSGDFARVDAVNWFLEGYERTLADFEDGRLTLDESTTALAVSSHLKRSPQSTPAVSSFIADTAGFVAVGPHVGNGRAPAAAPRCFIEAPSLRLRALSEQWVWHHETRGFDGSKAL